MFLPIPIVALLILQGSHVANSAISCNDSADTITKQVVMTARVKAEFMVYNICDVVNFTLPSGLPDCSPYTWKLLPNITTLPNQDISPQSGEFASKRINLNDPSKFGVFCNDHCNNPNGYCAAIAVSPTFDREERPNCRVLEGKTAQISCISIGYPIISRIISKAVGSDGKDACQPIDSTTNNVTVGTPFFGMLNHSCNNVSLPVIGKNEFVCEVAFLPWGPNLNHSFTVMHSLYCNVTEENGDGEGNASTSNVISNHNDVSFETTSIAVIIPSAIVVMILLMLALFGIVLLIRRRFKCQPDGKEERDHTDPKLEAAYTTSGDEQGAREPEEKDSPRPRVAPQPSFAKRGVTEVRNRHKTSQTHNT